MASKGPKKKESKEQVSNTQKDNTGIPIPASISEERVSGKRKTLIPVWPEWNDQELANEKWDIGKKEKERGRSPTAMMHYFDDPEGKIILPSSLQSQVKLWKRMSDICEDKIPVVVNVEHLHETNVDLLAPNEHIIDSELIRSIITTLNSLLRAFAPAQKTDTASSVNRMKTTLSKEQKDSKLEKNKKEIENYEETYWRPWDLIWPKENPKMNTIPCISPSGKYAVKLFWMGCYRKIVVDETIPCDEDMKPLLPFTDRQNELWPVLISKALIKVASLDYFGGDENSEMGDVNLIHCLTGWLPEQIPIHNNHKDKIWKLLLNILPNWKLPQPNPPIEDCSNDVKEVVEELLIKDSKEIRSRKEDRPKDEKKTKFLEKNEIKKEKAITPSPNCKSTLCTPDVLVFASFSNPPSKPFKVSKLKEMADESEKLRQSGFSHYLSHPVHVSVIRDCPLIPPPVPIQLPRWKLIRQKKKKEIREPSCHPEQHKEPKFLHLKSMLHNFKVGSTAHLHGSPLKWDRFKPITPLESFEEELHEDVENEMLLGATSEHDTQNSEMKQDSCLLPETADSKVRSLSITSQTSSASLSSKKNKKNKQKERKSISKETPLMEASTEILGNNERLAENDDLPPVNTEQKDDDREADDLWMDFDDFCQCFIKLWIYHKPKLNTKHNYEIKSFDGGRSEKSKKVNNGSRSGVLSPISNLVSASVLGETYSPYLLLDSIKETELIITFSSFSRWFDNNESESLVQNKRPPAGTLVVEPYIWKQIAINSPVLRILTTGTKGAALILPPGRHVFRVVMNAPLGFHICVSSSQDFVFGDENYILQHLTKESSRFIDHGKNTLLQLGKIVKSFDVPGLFKSCTLLLGTEDKKNALRRDHFEALFKSLKAILKSEMDDSPVSPLNFAIAALKYQSYLQLKKFKPENSKVRSISTPYAKGHSIEFVVHPHSASLPSISTELVNVTKNNAATSIQAVYKGYYTMKLNRASISGTKENTMVCELLKKIWSHVEANIEQKAVQVYQMIFTENPHLFQHFPFYCDKWNKIAYADYNGSCPEQPIDNFYVLYREIFHSTAPGLILPKFYCGVPNCNLKIVNNDTSQEMKTVFTKVVPQILPPNKFGYTIVAMGYNESYVIPAGKFHLRIIGEKEPLPTPTRDQINTQFVTKEVRDYYVPNQYQRIFRYSIKVTEELLSTIQFNTSKEDVYIKIQVLDNEEELYSCEGKAYVVIPSLLLFKDRILIPEENKKASISRAGSGRSSTKLFKRPPSSRRSPSPDKSKKRSALSFEAKTSGDEFEEEQIHKYIIQGFVQRNTWPLTKTQWDFIETLKDPEKQEEAANESNKMESSVKNSANKNRKVTKGNRSRPESQTQNVFDVSKPHWNLRVVVDSNMENAVEIKRDTDREDEMKAIKTAWESLQPGRAAKAQLSRMKYIESHNINPVVELNNQDKRLPDENEGDTDKNKTEKAKEEGPSTSPTFRPESETNEVWHEPPPKDTDVVLKAFDITPYIRSTGKKIFLNEVEEENLRADLQKKFLDYENMRELVLSMRENNRLERNVLKEKQISEYEAMQTKLDEAREDLYKKREMYREKFVKLPEIEVVVEEVDKKKRTPSGKRKSGKSPSKGKKK